MSERYDVVIVGAGYAGLCCGLTLQGKKVLILEARKEIARKHRGCQCGLYPFGEGFELKGDDIYFYNTKVRVQNAVMSMPSHMELVSGRHTLITTLKNPMPIVDEGKIKGTLENICREEGVHIIKGARVRSIETDGQQVTIYADRKYEASYLVGADGAHSLVMRHLPITRKRIGNFLELEIEAESMDIPGDGFFAEIKSMLTGLYAQPYGEGYMLGVFQGFGINGKRIDLKRYLEESIQKLKVKSITRRYGCFIPIHLSATSSYYKNILMAGDTVGSFSMITITGAMMMGQLAGEALRKKMEGVESAFKEYDKKWRKVLQQGNIDSMRYSFFLLRRLNEERMERLFRTLGGSDLGSVGWAYYLRRIPGIIKVFF